MAQYPSRPISSRSRLFAAPGALALAAFGSQVRPAKVQAATVRLRSPMSSGAESDLFNKLLANALTALPDITIELETVTADYDTKLQTDIAAGSGPDIFFLDSMSAPNYTSSGALLPLDDHMAESGVSTEDFYPGLISVFQFDGQTYGLPKDWSCLGMVYNADALEAAGVPSAPTTWDELTAAGQALLDATGEPRIMIPPDFARYLAFHYQAGATVYNEDVTEITIYSEEAAAALDFYYGLYRDGIATTPADAGAERPGAGLAQGFSDLVFEGNWVVPFLQSGAPDLNWAVAEMPGGPAGKATLAFTASYSINASTQVADASWQVVNYLTGTEGMTTWSSLGLAMPTRPALADAWSEQFPDRAAFLAGGDYARGWQVGVGGQAFLNDANAELQALFAGSQDVATTLANWEAAAQEGITLRSTS